MGRCTPRIWASTSGPSGGADPFLLSSVLSACVTAFAGPISFVGIAVPHLVKSSFRTAKPIVIIPACFLGGAVFCLFCDLIARTVFAPTELSISSVTAVFGAPVVIYMMVSPADQIHIPEGEGADEGLLYLHGADDRRLRRQAPDPGTSTSTCAGGRS